MATSRAFLKINKFCLIVSWQWEKMFRVTEDASEMGLCSHIRLF